MPNFEALNAWNQCLAHYERRKVLYEADRQVGRYFMALSRYDGGKYRMEKLGGSEAAKRDPEFAAEWEEIWSELRAAEDENADLYFYPMNEAAKALIGTPAPDARAIEIKLAAADYCAIGVEEMDIMPIVQADVARLAGDTPVMVELDRKFSEWRTAIAEINSGPEDADDTDRWAIVDAAEAVILNTPAIGPRVSIMRTTIALQHSFTTHKLQGPLVEGDMPALLAVLDDMSWIERAMVRSIQALIEGEA